MTIRITAFFRKQLKHLMKMYRHAEHDCMNELHHFDSMQSFSLGANLYKIRIPNSDIPCGKSGGYRIIAFFQDIKGVLVPLLAYSKREKDNVTIKEIEHALENVLKEIQQEDA
ncbi:addiction module toxin, RelE/StbE family, putative [Candidatus Moduliflexus flocculans]|uniref:Addiction module toxin, RelE/StbE family, putative n=1 Tax=Candidatus Moduliflexus flocculans TaxID=1499966 RepID=A0A0S6VPM5_9BACT|nr:addiction module toxin, RelE/StbE family, putative [Candidatus Moduliflexus flocculans]